MLKKNIKMKKTIFYSLSLIALLSLCSSCENERFIDDIYVEPRAAFTIDDKEVFDVFESVHFANRGEGQKFAVWPGDSLHVYGKTGNSGYACNTDGTYSYSYQEPGEYTAVWVASSIKASGEVVTSVDSIRIKVQAQDGGLNAFSITRMARLSDFGSSFFYESYGDFVEADRIVCPMPYSLWDKYICRTLGVKFTLSSDFATLYWEKADGDVALTSESTAKVFRFDNDMNELEPQTLKVRTSSGIEERYEVAAVMIPEFTSFIIKGVEGTVTRDLSGFNRFNMEVSLPDGTDATALTPEFVVMGNDTRLLTADKTAEVTVNGQTHLSGQTAVDFSSPVDYVITYSVPGSEGYVYRYESHYHITVKNSEQ